MAIHSSILAWRILMVGYSPWGCKESDTTERLSTAQKMIYLRFSVCLCVKVCVNVSVCVCVRARAHVRVHMRVR